MALFESLIKAEKTEKKTTNFTVTMVHYTKLTPSENNNYSMESIKELAQMIVLAGGVKQNLLARKKTPDEYELIAGHRRRQAIQYLVEELGLEEYAMMPVHVERDGDLMSEVNLILTNCGARTRSDWERMMEVSRLTDLLKAMQSGSQEEQDRFRAWIGLEPGLSGRELRKLVAELTGMSETKVAQLNHINNNLSPDLMDRFQEGKVGISAADKAAALPPEKQQELSQKETVTLSDVKSVSDSDTAKVQDPVSDSDTEKVPDIVSDSDTEKAPNSVSDSDTEKAPDSVSDSDTEKWQNPEDEIIDERSYLKDMPSAKESCINRLAKLLVEHYYAPLLREQHICGISSDSVMRFLGLVQKTHGLDLGDNIEASIAAEIIEFSRGQEDLGVCSFERFTTCVQKCVDQEYEKRRQQEAENKLASEAAPKSEPEEAKPVLDLERYDAEMMDKMIKDVRQRLAVMGDTWKENQPDVYTKYRMMLKAFVMFQRANEK